jgi:hypothetical protein
VMTTNIELNVVMVQYGDKELEEQKLEPKI